MNREIKVLNVNSTRSPNELAEAIKSEISKIEQGKIVNLITVEFNHNVPVSNIKAYLRGLKNSLDTIKGLDYIVVPVGERFGVNIETHVCIIPEEKSDV